MYICRMRKGFKKINQKEDVYIIPIIETHTKKIVRAHVGFLNVRRKYKNTLLSGCYINDLSPGRITPINMDSLVGDSLRSKKSKNINI